VLSQQQWKSLWQQARTEQQPYIGRKIRQSVCWLGQQIGIFVDSTGEIEGFNDRGLLARLFIALHVRQQWQLLGACQ
jgi:hypothetical protein